MSDEFQARNSVTKAQHASASPAKAEKQESRNSTPKSQIVIPRLKLPLNNNNDVSEPKILFKAATAENLLQSPQGEESPSNFYGGNSGNICRIKIRKNFRKIQIKNKNVVTNPFAKRTASQ